MAPRAPTTLSIQVGVMFMVTNLIEPRMGKLISNNLIGNKCPGFRDGLLGSYFFKLTLGSVSMELFFLDSRFQNHPESVILQKYQSLSNQNFKHNSAHMSSLNLTPKPSFEPGFRMFIINNDHTKTKHLQSLDFCLNNFSAHCYSDFKEMCKSA